MSTEGTTRGLFELNEVIVSAVFLLVIGGLIFAVYNPNYIPTTLAAKENSYLASQISDSNIIIEIQYKDEMKIDNILYKDPITEKESKVIEVQIEKSEGKSNYFGGNIDLVQEGNKVTIQSSNS